MDNLDKWVEEAQPERQLFRQAIHTILHAITIDDYLRSNMVMKGGMLLGIQHGNSRHTEDIDFSTEKKDIVLEKFIEHLNDALVVASDDLPYPLACVVQSARIQPKIKCAKYPSFQLTIGYSSTLNVNAHKRLTNKQSSTVVKIDYSLNEKSYDTEEITITENEECLVAYSVIDILAEKYRSIIQQVVRKRSRRQDVYDIWHLLVNYTFSDSDLSKILESFEKKSSERVHEKYIKQDALQRKEIIDASEHEYSLLIDEVEGDFPEFKDAYKKVRTFFESLPWT